MAETPNAVSAAAQAAKRYAAAVRAAKQAAIEKGQGEKPANG